MYKTSARGYLCLALALLVSVTLFANDFEKQLLGNINRMARDMHLASRAINESGNEGAVAALSRESASVDNLKRLIASLETADQIERASQQIRMYGYRVTNQAEKRAFEESLNILESRVKYLAQTENPQLMANLNAMQALRKEFEGKQQNRVGTNVSDRMQLLARTSATTSATAAPRKTSRSSEAQLGAHVINGNTAFSVYAPDATEIKLHLFKNAADTKGVEHLMTKSAAGIWHKILPGELYGTYYGFTADGPKTPGFLFDPARLLSDPYAFANVDHDGKSIVVDRSFKWTDQNFKRPACKDAIIYEMHVKDFTAHQSSGVKAPHQGNYLGMLHGKSSERVLGHLKQLGVNVIQLMPIHEFDNKFAGVTNHWGYMTSHFFAPECSFASAKSGQAVKELKTLINGLHNEGFAVVLDVVFNHTAEGDHRGAALNFKGFDNPGYYRLMDDRKFYWNGTGCGNEMRTENPMTGKMILDSLKYWQKEYHVDGFRFDLGTIIDKKT
ncbi:MAG: hypothetical protein ACD_39C00374G0001, partial [uncultured bacterium]